MAFTSLDLSLTPSVQSNIVINGGMEIWQRGTSFSTPADSTFTADRWFVRYDGTPTFVVSQEASLIDSGSFAMKLNITAVGGSPTFLQIRQLVENYPAYAGKILTLTARVRSNVAGIQIRIDDGTTSFVSNAHTGGGAYETLTATGTMSASISRLLVTLGNSGSNPAVSTIYFDSVMLTIGAAPATFFTPNPQSELAKCQRYFVRLGGEIAANAFSMAQAYSTTQAYGLINLPVKMRTAPTVTSTAASNFQVTTSTGGGLTLSALTFTGQTTLIFQWNSTSAASLTAGNSTALLSTGTSGTIDVAAELTV